MSNFFRGEHNNVYINQMRPLLRKKALFSDMTADYVDPPEPNPYSLVKVNFRAGLNNVDKVYLVIGNEKHLMMKYAYDEEFDYYQHEIQLDNVKVEYHFEVVLGRVTCYYDMRGVIKNACDLHDYYKFKLIPGLRVPKWAKGAVMYQIYIDRFCNGDPTNNVLTDEYNYIGEHVGHVEDWNRYPAAMDVREFYGGDLQGVLDKLDYLEGLGIDVIYFNPLFVSPSNHKYDIQDYDHIDPHIGKIVNETGELLQPNQKENRFASRYINRVANLENLEASNAMFAKVVEEAHKRGIKVILDGVFNHCGSFNKWMDRERIYEDFEGYQKGAHVSADSPYRNYFDFRDQNRWPYNTTYDGWWGHETLPKLNYEASRELYDYILYIGRKWVSPPYNADGWRLDVAADLGHSKELNHQFWKDFNNAVKEANPEAIVLAEHYGDPKEWLENGEWDTVMNYDAFMEPVTWFLTGMQKHSDDFRNDMLGNADAFWGAMHHHGSAFSTPSLQAAMNELSNHDHSRFLTRTNHVVGRVNTLGAEAANQNVNKAVMREAVVMQMTWPGAPTIYYGDEAGVCGFTDPDNRRTYPWGHEDQELIQFHRDIIRIHKEYEALKTGSLKYMEADYNIVGYGRFNLKEQFVILVNNNDHDIIREVTVWDLGIPRECVMTRVMLTTFEGYTVEQYEYPVVSGKMMLSLPKFSAIVLKHVRENEEEIEKEELKK